MLINLKNALNIYGDLFRDSSLPKAIYKSAYLTSVLIYQNIQWSFFRLMKKSVVNILGNKMLLDYSNVGFDLSGSSIIKQLALDKIREVEATKTTQNLLKKNDVVLEIGANIGYYALMEAKIVGDKGKIYAIEPEPHNVEMLRKNVDINNYSDIIDVFPLAVSDKDSFVNLQVSKFSNRHILSTKSDTNTIKIRSVTIDSFLIDKRTPKLIRMDVEGAELAVIKGASKTLQNNLKIFMEIHPRELREFGGDARELLHLLKKHSFKLSKLITYDRNIRRKIGYTKVHLMTIDELLDNKEILDGKEAFEVFFEK